MQAAQLIHKTQMEPKDKAAVFWISTDKQKDKINTGCDTQNILKWYNLNVYNYLMISLVLYMCSLCSDDFVISIPYLAKVCLHFSIALFLTNESKFYELFQCFLVCLRMCHIKPNQIKSLTNQKYQIFSHSDWTNGQTVEKEPPNTPVPMKSMWYVWPSRAVTLCTTILV